MATQSNGIDWRVKGAQFARLLGLAVPLADSLEEAIEAVDAAMAVEQLVPPPQPSVPKVDAAFSHDAFNPKAQRVLDKAMKAVKDLSAAARKELRAALKLDKPAEMAQAVVEFVVRYRNQLSQLLGRTNLAALLEGALEVASKMPPVPLPGLGGPPPVSLPPDAATGLLARLEAMPEMERWRAIMELPRPEEQSWVQQALDMGGSSGPMAPLTIAAGGDDDVHFPIIEEAVKNLSQRNVLGRYEYDRLDAAARQKAFTVAGAEAQETLLKIRDALAENIAEGADLETFREKVLADVEPNTFLSPLHQEQVWRNNVQTAFSDGQLTVLSHPIVRTGFPYAFYSAIHDDRVRPNHLALEKLGIQGTNIYRIDDPVFQLFRPPWDFSDRCGWTPCTVQFAAERGIQEAIEWLRTGIEPMPAAFVPMPRFRPPPGFDRSLSGAPLSIRLSMLPMELDAAFGMDAQGQWHGPTPPAEGWVEVAKGPRGGKVWRQQGGQATPQQPVPSQSNNRQLSVAEVQAKVDALPNVPGKDSRVAQPPFPVALDSPSAAEWIDGQEWGSGVKMAQGDKSVDVPLREVNLDNLVATQDFVIRDQLKQMVQMKDGGPRPLVMYANGKMYIHDGTHRAALAKLRGEKTIQAFVWNADDPRANVTLAIDAAFGMDAQGLWHGPKPPPGEGWVEVGKGPRGGKVWRQQPQQAPEKTVAAPFKPQAQEQLKPAAQSAAVPAKKGWGEISGVPNVGDAFRQKVLQAAQPPADSAVDSNASLPPPIPKPTAAPPPRPQTPKPPSGTRDELKARLERSPFRNVDIIGDINANATFLVTTADGSQGVWKPAQGEHPQMVARVGGDLWRREIATSVVASVLGVGDLVPPTVFRSEEAKGGKGSLQLFVPDAEPAHKIADEVRFGSPENFARAAALDFFTLALDRHGNNWLLTPDPTNPGAQRLHLIDNGLTFGNTHEVVPDADAGHAQILAAAIRSDVKIPAETAAWAKQRDRVQQLLTSNGLGEPNVGLAMQRLDLLADSAAKGETFRQCWERSGIKAIPDMIPVTETEEQAKAKRLAEMQAFAAQMYQGQATAVE